MNAQMTPILPARLNARGGYTLVEILVATTLTLILMFAVVQIFAMISGSVSDSRALLEMNDRLRSAKTRLQMDLEGLTVVPLPPRGEEDDGYLEIIEGAVGVSTAITTVARNYSEGNDPDTTVGDFDDVLMFTTRNVRTPFADGSTESDVAEVAWFVYGNRLYRRVKPVERVSGGSNPDLSDLTLRTNRNQLVSRTGTLVSLPDNTTARDFWVGKGDEDSSGTELTKGSFVADDDDVILNNVIGFDVKVFDPLYNDYVDLGYKPGMSTPTSFSELGQSTSSLTGKRIYDTWSTSYGSDEPPYPSALRGIQIKIRVFEPDSRHIREVTVIQDFLPR